MFDVHCLVHRNAEMQYFPQLVKSLSGEREIDFHVLYGTENVGQGRCKGWLKGKHEWVTFVDYDDMIVPGIFNKVSKIINDDTQIWFTDEVLVDSNSNYIKHGWSSNPEGFPKELTDYIRIDEHHCPHHLLIFHRDCITPEFVDEVSDVFWNPEVIALRHVVSRGGNYRRIPFVGYCWRIHEQNGSYSGLSADVIFDARGYI